MMFGNIIEIEKWEVIEKKDVSPSPWFPLYVHKVRLPDGKIIDDYYVSKLGDVGMVVAVTKDNEIVFVRQYKHGVEEITLELPAGRVDGRTPEETARSELEEETGIVAGELSFLGRLYISPTKDPATTYGFMLRNAEVTKEQKLDVTEKIQVVYIPSRNIDELIKSGKINTADTLGLLAITKLKYPELFEF